MGWTDPASLGAGSVAWSAIGDPDADATVAFAGYEQTITSTLNEANHAALIISNTTADLTADVSLLDLKFADDGDANGSPRWTTAW